MSFNLDDYTPVNDRTLMFYKQYPAGVITTQPAKIIEIDGKWFISVMARVYLDRHMEDAPITEAEAWEPFPGTTPYTRNSEQMNAATSAIGRALGQLGIGIEKGMASGDEVKTAQNRTNNDTMAAIERKAHRDAPSSAPKSSGHATPKQVDAIVKMCQRAGIHAPEDGAIALSQLLGRVINDLYADIAFSDVDTVFGAGVDGIKQAWQDAKGYIITKTAPADDPWAGEVLA